MSDHRDLLMIVRAVVVLRATQNALHLTERRTDEYSRLLTSVMAQEAALDEALDWVRDQLMTPEPAND
jgi:hypothetical protein